MGNGPIPPVGGDSRDQEEFRSQELQEFRRLPIERRSVRDGNDAMLTSDGSSSLNSPSDRDG